MAQAAQVDRVIDGDTISVRLDGARYLVRLTGVDGSGLASDYAQRGMTSLR